MTTRKRFLLFGGALTSFVLLALTACNTEPQGIDDTADEDKDHYHEKSFSWDDGSSKKTLAKTAALQTRFNTESELGQAIQDLQEKLEDKTFTDSLWKPIDYSCGELELAIWNTYGTVFLNDTVVFSENTLKSGCALSESAGETSVVSPSHDSLVGKSSGWTWWSQEEVSDRQYPYKMIGRSWKDFDIIVYKSTGGETQFKKERKKLGFTGWYDTDATRIGVRIFLFDCGTSGAGRYCSFHKEKANSNSNDDYASERDPATGEIQISNNGVSVRPARLKISDAVYSMHSVDHAGLQFRASSSSGITSTTITEASISPYYVTW